MILYRLGEILYKNGANVVFESQGIGYSIQVPDHERLEVNQKLKLYVFDVMNDYVKQTFGFREYLERALFVDLISLSGIGVRIAFNLLDKGWKETAIAIAQDDLEFLTSASYVQEKNARIIVANLGSKWEKILKTKNILTAQANNVVDNKNTDKASIDKEIYDEVFFSLKRLGFKDKAISDALIKIESYTSPENLIEKSIELITREMHAKRYSA